MTTFTIDKHLKHIEINDRMITSDQFLRIIDLVDDIDGWTIHFNFNK
jgi:hypothetical protein